MASLSTLGSPGIEVREIDNSVRVDVDPSTTYFVPGFASQGPVEEVHSISTMSDFENIYGVPTNDAERYFYHTVKSIIDNSGDSTVVYVSRLPYGEKSGDTVSSAFTLLSYPAVPVIKTNTDVDDFDSFVVSEDDETNLKNIFKLKVEGIENDISPDNISYSLIFDEYYLLDEYKINEFRISQIKLYSGTETKGSDTALGNLPQHDNLSSYEGYPQLCGELKYGENGTSVITEKGNIALEYNSSTRDFSIHLAFNIRINSEKVGVLTITSTYKKYEYVNKTQVTKFSGVVAEGVPFKINESFEIATSYDGQSEDQYIGGKYDTTKFADDITYVVGAPATFHISLDQYYRIITGDNFKWSRRPYSMREGGGYVEKDGVYVSRQENSNSTEGVDEDEFGLFDAIHHSAFIVINTSRSIINDSFEGFYLGMCDNMFVTPSSSYKYDAIRNIKVTTKTVNVEKEIPDKALLDSHSSSGSFDTIGESRLGFYLTDNHSGSVSKIMERSITPMDISSTEYDDTLNLGLFKLSKSVTANATLKLNYNLREKYNASIGKSRVKSEANATKPVSYFIENVTENSGNILFMVNPYISGKSFVDLDGVLHSKVRLFGEKLIKNLDKFEEAYLIDSQYTSSAGSDVSLMSPIKLSRSSIESYRSLIKQAGVSPYFIKKNFNISENIDKKQYENFVMADSLYPFGVYSSVKTTSKIIGNLPDKLERALDLVRNDEEYTKIDIIPESGLGTIYVYSNGNTIAGESTDVNSLIPEDSSGDGQLSDDDSTIDKMLFDSTVVLQGIEDLRTGRSSLSEQATKVVNDYLSVLAKFYAFCNAQANGGRGDSFFIGDVPRGILVKGKDTKVANLFGSRIENSAYDSNDSVNHSFSTSIMYPIKHVFDSIVSSYGSTYAQWLKIHDDISGEKMWIPVSGHVAAAMGRSDFQGGPWLAAAGVNRGVISGAVDCAINPNQDQRTDLYKLCINSVPKLPNRGITIWGIRTMSKKASAFDQNTCRRTFLYMENTIKRYMRNYIFEPNTAYTRLQIVNDIEPFLESVAISGGIYSWSCVCDTSNNTPEIINNGDMAVDIAAAPTRTAENIILNFTANKYTSDISNSEN